MKITRESLSVDITDPQFVHLTQERIKDTGKDIGGQLWFERANLPWVVDTLRACLTTYGFPETTKQGGQDSLKIFESGPEQAPVINLYNVRPDGAVHGGVYARSMSKPAAARLLDDLARI